MIVAQGGMAFMILEGMEEYVNLSGSITYYWTILMIIHVICPHLSYYILDKQFVGVLF